MTGDVQILQDGTVLLETRCTVVTVRTRACPADIRFALHPADAAAVEVAAIGGTGAVVSGLLSFEMLRDAASNPLAQYGEPGGAVRMLLTGPILNIDVRGRADQRALILIAADRLTEFLYVAGCLFEAADYLADFDSEVANFLGGER